MAHGLKNFFNLRQGEFFLTFFGVLFINFPDVAGLTAGLADVGYGKSQVEGGSGWHKAGPGKMVLGDFGKNIICEHIR